MKRNDALIRFLARFCMLSVVLGLLQLFTADTFHKDPVLRRLETKLAAGCRVIFFSDSVNRAYDHRDTDNGLPLSDFLQTALPGLPLVSVDHQAYHFGVYEAYVRWLVRQEKAAGQVLVVPINLRSFSTSWRNDPAYQFEPLQRWLAGGIFSPALEHPLRVFHYYPASSITPEQFDRAPVYDGQRVAGVVEQYKHLESGAISKDTVMNGLIYHYMEPIASNNVRLIQLRALITQLQHHNIPALFYFTPIDFDTGKKYLGARFMQQVNDNCSTIKQVLEEAGIEPLDLSAALPAERFSWSVIPNEHLNQGGREFVARVLAGRIRTLAKSASPLPAHE